MAGASVGASDAWAATSWQKESAGKSTDSACLDNEFTSQLGQGWELSFCFWMEGAMNGLEREGERFSDVLVKGKPLVGHRWHG